MGCKGEGSDGEPFKALSDNKQPTASCMPSVHHLCARPGWTLMLTRLVEGGGTWGGRERGNAEGSTGGRTLVWSGRVFLRGGLSLDQAGCLCSTSAALELFLFSSQADSIHTVYLAIHD